MENRIEVMGHGPRQLKCTSAVVVMHWCYSTLWLPCKNSISCRDRVMHLNRFEDVVEVSGSGHDN
jgi:hypothetical protein